MSCFGRNHLCEPEETFPPSSKSMVVPNSKSTPKPPPPETFLHYRNLRCCAPGRSCFVLSSVSYSFCQTFFDEHDVPHAFFLLGTVWVESRAERPSVSEVSGQLRVQFGCKLPSKLSKERIEQGKQQIKVTKFQI